MSDRSGYGNLTLALAAAAALIFMVGAMSGLILEQQAKVHQVNAAYQQNAKHDRQQSAHEVYRLCYGMTGLAFRNCIADQLETYYSKQATNEDLKAQKDMVLWAFWMFVVSVAMAILTAIGVLFVYRTLQASWAALREAKDTTAHAAAAADFAKQELQIAVENAAPYVFVEAVHFERLNDNRVIFDLAVRNVGERPALNVTVSYFAAVTTAQGITEDESFFVRDRSHMRQRMSIDKAIYVIAANSVEHFKKTIEENRIFDNHDGVSCFGYVTYEAINGTKYKSDFAFWLIEVPKPSTVTKLVKSNYGQILPVFQRIDKQQK